jgi:putative ABC transport system permease protein
VDVPTGLASQDRVLVADMDLPQSRYPADRISPSRAVLQRLRDLRVRSAALLTNVPLDRAPAPVRFAVEGDASPPGQAPKAEMVFATPGYLETLGIPLLRGRDLQWTDVKSAPHVVLVNQAFVRRFFPNADPLGRRITELVGPDDPWEIAGVIGDVHTQSLDRAPSPLMVVPLLQFPVPTLRVAARAAGGNPMQLFCHRCGRRWSPRQGPPLFAPRRCRKW